MIKSPEDRQHMRRRRRYSASAFFLSILIISTIILIHFAVSRLDDGSIVGGSRDSIRSGSSSSHGLEPRDEECRKVHTAHDQCAFIRDNCPDEEAGLLSYLQLYYCQLAHAKPVAFILLVLWLGLLFGSIGISASDYLCVNLSTIASLLGMSESMAGVTLLAFGNGSPDVFSTFAAMSTHSGSLAVGELIGAAGFITAVVAGSMAIVRPFKVAKRSFVRDVGFFIIAASFSMVFLVDGQLRLWECIVMVVFYIFYVVMVVAWHWVLRRRRCRKERDARARDHFQIPDSTEPLLEDAGSDDETRAAHATRPSSRTPTMNDFAALEQRPDRGGVDEDDEDEARDRWMAEITNSMRVKRPRSRHRYSSGKPIRPSLVGALEFRSVLSSLEKSRNQQHHPINLRRYSDNPAYTLAQQQPNISRSNSNPQFDQLLRVTSIQDNDHRLNRLRSVSVNDASGLRLNGQSLQIPQIGRLDAAVQTPPMAPTLVLSQHNLKRVSQGPADHESEGPAGSGFDLPNSGFSSLVVPNTGILLHSGEQQESVDHSRAPPSPRIVLSRSVSTDFFAQHGESAVLSPSSPFPQYYDEPTHVESTRRLPRLRSAEPSFDSESLFRTNRPLDESVRWWPRKLPGPAALASTLFPTLSAWRDKSFFDKALALAAAPTVLLLTITVPVIDSNKVEDMAEVSTVKANTHDSSPSLNPYPSQEQLADGQTMLNTDNEPREPDGRGNVSETSGARGNDAYAALSSGLTPGLGIDEGTLDEPSSKEWNRWLVVIQTFTAPLFVVFIIWANVDDDHSLDSLLISSGITLLGSLLALAAVMLTTSHDKEPKYRYLLSFVGFIVSIAWISAIAGEVVGVLKAIGVIFGISDAILGLTIFAVGNSCGDLFADLVIARLGFPVMALSACFGGPMLNILLGIGLGGMYMTIVDGKGRHHRHPKRPVSYPPYQIEVGRTLMVSGIVLLITLLGLLVAVPMNKWVMDRKIGWGLVALWCTGTAINIALELTSYGP